MARAVLRVRTYMAGAFLVLAGARALQRMGVIGPARFATALTWSDGLIRRGMAAWREGSS